VIMLDYDTYVATQPQEPEPAWVAVTAAFFRQEDLSRRGAIYRLVFVSTIVALVVAVLIAEYHR
jgi:hypothetical protein